MLVAIEIGNSNVVIGIYQKNSWTAVWRFPTQTTESPEKFYQQRLLDQLLEANVLNHSISHVVISSVVPSLTPVFIKIGELLTSEPPIVVGPDIYEKLTIKISNPFEIGADLVANSVAAHTLYQKHCIIIDFGTALTFTTVDQAGAILGVSIAPGIKTAMGALYQKTAQLPPEVPLDMPISAIGKDTVEAIQGGIMIGYVGLVRHVVQTIRQEVGHQYITIATGGLSGKIVDLVDEFDIRNPHLTLEGLRIIATM